jgi:levoglucosan dehydrogenase
MDVPSAKAPPVPSDPASDVGREDEVTRQGRPIRVGLIGAGYIAGVHSAAYRVVAGTYPSQLPPVELVRVVDPAGDRAAALASAWGWREIAHETEAVTEADDIDVVDICAPNHAHASVALAALGHGKHVVCEKPLAAELADAREMALAARQARRVAQVCFYYRTWPAVAHARHLIEDGAIGEITSFAGRMLQDYAADPRVALGWRASRQEGGAGALDDLGSHILDIARFLVGDMRVVAATTRSTVQRQGPAVVDAASARVEFASGASGVIEASWAAHGHACDLGFEIEGTHGAIRFAWERANELHLRQGSSPPGRLLVGPGMPGAGAYLGVPGQQMGYRDAFTLGLGRMLAAVAAGERSATPTFDDGLRVAELVAAICRASQQDGHVDTVNV